MSRPPELPPLQHRSALMRLLHTEYRRQLAQSLQGAALMELAEQERPDVTLPSGSLISWTMDAPGEPSFPAPTSIVQAYDEADAGLLLLGDLGAGKSTLLRELACELLTCAEQDATHPVPMIVNLSSWTSTKFPPASSLTSWLVDELQLVYAIPSLLGQAWFEQNQLLLLLDGLDEVEPPARPSCIEAINAYRGKYSVPLVVCAGSREYLAQQRRLRLPVAVEVQPLTSEQVDGYFERLGPPLAAVRATLRSNAVLRELVTTPLMLSVVMLAYRGKTVQDLPQLGSAEDQQRQVIKDSVDRMLEQGARTWHYASQQSREWLIWLAGQMKQHHLPKFYVERLQPSWLPTKRSRTVYVVLNVLVVGLVSGFLFGLVAGLHDGLRFGLLLGLHSGKAQEIRPSEKFTWSLELLWRWPQSGLSGAQMDEYTRLRPNQGIQTSGWNGLRSGLLFGLLAGLFTGLLFGLQGGLLAGQLGGLLYGLLGIGLLGGLGGGLQGGLRYGGGEAYLQHYVLRYVLWRSKAMPWHYVRFLEEATERMLLHRVGGGYRFIHPLFLDYFAGLSTSAPPHTVR